jgi:hypothetical protein
MLYFISLVRCIGANQLHGEIKMHHHNQTIADLEREQAPSTFETIVCLILLLAALGAVSVFLFSF